MENPEAGSDTGLLSTIALRPPQQVMRLSRLGSFHQTRLSFMRVLLRRLVRENWRFERRQWQVDKNGVGHAVYTATGPKRSYSLIAFSHDLDPSLRSDRVIAEAWDATFTLFDGIPTEADVTRLKNQVPLQEAGRISAAELSLSRANRSVRLFDHVRRCLAAGQQPTQEELDKTGYLMRTTAVYGSGKFGAIDRRFIADREELTAPFQCELLAVLMIRNFSVDIVEHLAHCDNPTAAVSLAKPLARSLGIGNSTGLGMAPFLVNHPTLLNNWIHARETALARVRSIEQVGPDRIERFKHYLQRQIISVDDWETAHPYQQQKIADLDRDLKLLAAEIESPSVKVNGETTFWNALYLWAERSLSEEGQECIVTLLLEIYPELTDDLASGMSIDEEARFKIDGKMSLQSLQRLIDEHYGFARRCDFSNDTENALFWYASEEKLEPRLGRRFEESGAHREHPLAIARDVDRLAQTIADVPDTSLTVARFLLAEPEHRHVVRRIQQIAAHPYAEIADNLIADGMLPIDLLRCKLAFFGAVKFDPRSDRWLRITLFQHAPLLEDLDDKTGFTSAQATNEALDEALDKALDDTLIDDAFDSWVYPPAP